MADELKRILIVDDEEDMVWSLQQNLANNTLRAEVHVARSGEQALDLLKRMTVDLVVTDIRMPGISGLTLLMEIKKHHPATAVIIMTAFPTDDFRSFASSKGAIHFLEKPFDINHLRDIIRSVLRETRGFSGTLDGIELTDIIQVNCLSRANAALRIVSASGSGTIYFQNGRIVHAASGDLEGAEAFYRIITFMGGTMESQKGAEPPRHTITMGCEALVMEGLRRHDEAMARKEQASAVGEEHDPLREILEELTGIPGVALAFLARRDGFIARESRPPGSDRRLNAELTGALTAMTLTDAEKALQYVCSGTMTMCILEYDAGSLFIQPLSAEVFLVVDAGATANLGKLMSTITRNREKLSKYHGN
jgi:CheY-like chemotaxis protein/predicted regulator of Ras-like GTPase activity (Roadblock/LC7/MglB family)